MPSELEEVKDYLENSLMFNELHEMNWYTNVAIENEASATVSLDKEGNGYQIHITFPMAFTDNDELRTLSQTFGELLDNFSTDECIKSAIRGNVYDVWEYRKDFADIDGSNRISCAVDFNKPEVFNDMNIAGITVEVVDIRDSIRDIQTLLDAQQLDIPEMQKMVSYLRDNNIQCFYAPNLLINQNKVTVDDPDKGLKFNVYACKDGTLELSGGLNFDPKTKDELDLSANDIIERIEQVSEKVGVYSMGLQGLYVYGFVDDGPNTSALIGPSASEAILCPECKDGPQMGYEYDSMFIPANEIMRIDKPEKSAVANLKDKEKKSHEMFPNDKTIHEPPERFQ